MIKTLAGAELADKRRLSVVAYVWVLVLFSFAGCATERPFVWVSDLPAAATGSEVVAIRPRDSVVVVVHDQPSLSGEYVVGEDGGILLPTIGEVTVAGHSIEEATATLRARFVTVVVNPVLTVSISHPAPIRVNVVGEVKTPASYELSRDRSVTAALAAAGWLTEFADRDRIFVVRRAGEMRIRFRAGEITSPDPAVSRFRLSDGDVVVVE